jgi:hypothetical protein
VRSLKRNDNTQHQTRELSYELRNSTFFSTFLGDTFAQSRFEVYAAVAMEAVATLG